MNTQEVSSALLDRARVIRLNLYSGQDAFRRVGRKEGWRDGERDIFFPIMHQQQGPNWHRGPASFSGDQYPASRPDSHRGETCQPSFTHTPVVRLRVRRDPHHHHQRTTHPAQSPAGPQT